MGRDALEKIKETVPEAWLTGFLQISGYKCTKPRDAVGLLFEKTHSKALTVQEIAQRTQLPRKTVYRTLEILEKKRLIHFSPSCHAYFQCQNPGKRKPDICHSFAICGKCHRVEEFVHAEHAHPRLKYIKNLRHDHEWVGRCGAC